MKTFSTETGGKKLTVTVDKIAKNANGNCIVQYGETTVLATATMGDKKDLDYFPLMVDFEEKYYAAGKIKGSRFVKRETRPPKEAVLTARLIDRSIRPLFNENTRREVQVILTPLSVDQKNDADIVGLWGASIALSISDIPWDGPIAGVRVGRDSDKNWILNPTYDQRKISDLDMIVCNRDNRLIMTEGEADKIKGEKVVESIKFGLDKSEKILDFIAKIQKKIGKEKIDLSKDKSNDQKTPTSKELKEMTKEFVQEKASDYLFDHPLKTKAERVSASQKIKDELEKKLLDENIGRDKREKAAGYVYKLVCKEVSRAILDHDKRIDGRDLDEVRSLSAEVKTIPQVHGSGLFSRGETQVLSIVTLGGTDEKKYLDTMEKSGKKRFLHHYNFPPYSVGETSYLRSASRREIGHGALVEKGIEPVLPKLEDFPHTIRIVSEVMSSNGSSSMASACGSVLAAMDAGIPISEPVAGVAMGIASEEKKDGGFKRYKIITDMQDLEDGPGGMDFKIIGTLDKVTAVQMDTKSKGLPFEVVEKTFPASKKARRRILKRMKSVISKPRKDLAETAPKISVFEIAPKKIGDVIGPGGKMINKIIDDYGVEIDIEDDGTVYISSANKEDLRKAEETVKSIVKEVEIGDQFKGKVVGITDFGAFVEITPGKDGLVHISEMAKGHVKHPSDVVSKGDIVKVKVIKKDKGKIGLTMLNKKKV